MAYCYFTELGVLACGLSKHKFQWKQQSIHLFSNSWLAIVSFFLVLYGLLITQSSTSHRYEQTRQGTCIFHYKHRGDRYSFL